MSTSIAMASTKQSFLIPTLEQPKFKNSNKRFMLVSCKSQLQEETNSDMSSKLGTLAIVTIAAGVLTLGSVSVGVGDAYAAKTGGRVGGQAFRSVPRSSSPRINNSRTNIYINPPMAPPLVGGYGYGYGVPFFGGWGWSPFSFYAPGPSVAIGFGGGFELLALFMFLGAVAAVIRRFVGSRDEEDDYY
ncbi:hypothetical protein RJ641_027415 [Dillenia turbinata]|uniref:Transmembrane protein n=1 Tax=Dillenia turbinata TaxID=194707 RepID=A0AAN8VW61_9MAGN